METEGKFMKIRRIIFALILFISLSGFLFFKFNEHELFDKIKTGSGSISNKVDQHKPISILLLGVDTGSDGRIDRGLSDSMMIVTLNPKTRKALVYSIPRDSLSEIISNGSKKDVQKINAAYEIGKAPVARNTVSEFLGVPINYSVTIDMGALKELVDFVGGVTVNSTIDVRFDKQIITKGTHHLNGNQALAYTRMRYQDPRGDYGRQMRQQEVLKKVVVKLQSPRYLVRVPALMDRLGTHISTDLTAKQMEQLVESYQQCGRHVISNQLVGREAWINQSSYQVIATDRLQAASDSLRKSLGLKPEVLSNAETELNKLNASFFQDLNSTTYTTDGLDSTYYVNNTH